MNKIILIVAAHPDDEILGCGATVARMVSEGYKAYSLILGEGVTSRDTANQEHELTILKKQAQKAGQIIGVEKTYHCNFPDNRFDTVPLLDIVKAVEKIKNELLPEIIFTHYEKDLNIDHRIVYQAVITACRPVQDETVKEVYSFEVLSSTEWNYPLSFSPDVFFDITSTIKTKKKAMEIYASELREFPHPRSLKGIEINALYWGMKTGLEYAEAFKTVRVVRK